MMQKNKLTQQELNDLAEALLYLHMTELKELCKKFTLAHSGSKIDIITRILTFASSDTQKTHTVIPAQSKAQKGKQYPLSPSTLILMGSYKNDEATRKFMKQLVGDYFHFTAFGQQWIKQHWLKGTPPTYAEFAKFWQQENEERKHKKATPNKEWAYLNFIQRFCEQHAKATQEEIAAAWHNEREKNKELALKILDRLEPE